MNRFETRYIGESAVESKVEGDASEPEASQLNSGIRRICFAVALPLVGIGVWQALSSFGIVPNYLLPSPPIVAATFLDFLVGQRDDAFSGTFMTHAVASLYRVLGGFGGAALVAVPFGVFVGVNRLMESLWNPIIQIFRPIPIFAWLPLSMIWFGLGVKPAMFLVFLGAFFPVLINSIIGAKFVEPRLVEAGRMLGMTERQILFKVIIPASLPSILAGLRVGIAIAWMALVVGEMTGVKEGLGSVLMDARNLLRTDLVIVTMFLIGGMGMLTDRLIMLAMAPALRWSPAAAR